MKDGLYTFDEVSSYMDKAEKPVMELLKASQEREKVWLDELIKFQAKVEQLEKALVDIRDQIPSLLDQNESPNIRHNGCNFIYFLIDRALKGESK